MLRKRMRPAQGFVMSPSEERDNLKTLIAMLNDKDGPEKDWQVYVDKENPGKKYGHVDVVKLLRIVRAWRKAGRDHRKAEFAPEDRADLEQFHKGIQVRLDEYGNLKLIDDYPSPYDAAAIQFTRLL